MQRKPNLVWVVHCQTLSTVPNFSSIGSRVLEPQASKNHHFPLTRGVALRTVLCTNVLHCEDCYECATLFTSLDSLVVTSLACLLCTGCLGCVQSLQCLFLIFCYCLMMSRKCGNFEKKFMLNFVPTSIHKVNVVLSSLHVILCCFSCTGSFRLLVQGNGQTRLLSLQHN